MTVKYVLATLAFSFVVMPGILFAQEIPAGDDAGGTRAYSDYEKPAACKSCHTDLYQQWTQAMMSQAYTHHWDEIEYFELAVPHAEKDPVVAGVKAGCNGCHAPQLDRSRYYLTGLYNFIDSDLDELDYETVTVSGTYLVARNLRLLTEYTRDLEGTNNRVVVGLVSAF